MSWHLFSFMMALLGVINIIWGALNAIAQIDLKKMIAYSSVSHMGYVLLGMSSRFQILPCIYGFRYVDCYLTLSL